jgi:hypothetical protein
MKNVNNSKKQPVLTLTQYEKRIIIEIINDLSLTAKSFNKLLMSNSHMGSLTEPDFSRINRIAFLLSEFKKRDSLNKEIVTPPKNGNE